MSQYLRTPYILKGGNALTQCHNLDRLSEDIDLDSPGKMTNHQEFFDCISKICNENGWSFRIAKNTPTVTRAIIHYGEDNTLKIETSYRRYDIDSQQYTTKNGITVYDINALAQMKAQALLNRDKARDLYDVCFLCVNEYDNLNSFSRFALENALSQKNLQQFDYLTEIEPQAKSGINFEKLETMLLAAMDKMGILTDEPIHAATTTDVLPELQETKPIQQQSNQYEI